MQGNQDPVRAVSVGESQYHKKRIQPWDIWEEYALNPWDADIIKRVLRNKPGQEILDYEKIKHVCDERIRQLRCESALAEDVNATGAGMPETNAGTDAAPKERKAFISAIPKPHSRQSIEDFIKEKVDQNDHV